jgi:site-specific DNA recombinase
LSGSQIGPDEAEDVAQLDRQAASLRRSIGRLIDSYAEGVIERAEFEPRIRGLRSRLAQVEERRRLAAEAAEADRELTLVIGRLDEFAASVRQDLDELDWHGKRDIIRTLVRRIEIDGDHVEIVFRVPPPPVPEGSDQSWQHCPVES